MTETEWLEKAHTDMDLLVDFVAAWHPRKCGLTPASMTRQLPITAPDANVACGRISIEIARTTAPDPAGRLRTAIDRCDVEAAYNLLSEAWFGVPESTRCWRIPGFSQAVGLIEDPPEENNEYDNDKET